MSNLKNRNQAAALHYLLSALIIRSRNTFGGAKRALEIAAAGGHNLLLIGPPGTGKTMAVHVIANMLNLPLKRLKVMQNRTRQIS